MERISRNSVSDTYFTKLSIPDSTLCKYEEGYIFSEKELENLLQNYRGLLPEFADSIQKKGIQGIAENIQETKKRYKPVIPS